MVELYIRIILLCRRHGEIVSLLRLADDLEMDYQLAWNRLHRLETLDCRLHIIRDAPGCPLRITYDCPSESPPELLLHIHYKTRVITLPQEML